MEDGGQELLGLSGQFGGEGGRGGGVVDGAGDGGEDLADCEGGGVAVCYYDFGRGGRGVVGVEVGGEGGGEMAFTAVAVEADVKGLGELEAPLREGAGVERMQEGVG